MAVGSMPDALSLVPMDGAHGGVRIDPELGMGRLADFESQAIARLSGRAVKAVIFRDPSAGAEADLRQATALVSRMLDVSGLGGRLAYVENVDGHAVKARLRDLYGRALRLIGERREAVKKLAAMAIEHRVLGRAALEAFARENGFGGRS